MAPPEESILRGPARSFCSAYWRKRMYFRRTSRAELPATPAAEPDVKVRLELLRETYKEVLDAVKHQDDKIGRLLTGLAFLTAATLAVAGLGGAEFVTRTFDVGVVAVPL
ncbi:MAG TPA: hypothetical protein PLS68_00425, partial [Actinotalea sp.]|nr:hypothetical protein [Actinotalea sp.]